MFVEPDDGLDPVLNEFNGAVRSIDLVVYELTERQVLAALESAQRRGVQVRVLLEEHPFGAGNINGSAAARLQQAGVQVRWANPRFSLTHEKAAVIDRREALILTLNLTASAFTRNREYGAIDRDPEDVAEVQALFDADWNRISYSPVRPALVVSPDNARRRFEAIVGQAAGELDVESEEVQDAGIEQALVASAKRGVHVRLVISPAEGGTDSNAAGLQRLKAGGVDVRYMRKPYVHAKLFVADGRAAFAGSENISRQSLDGNRELGVFLSEPASLSRLQGTFGQDWGSHS